MKQKRAQELREAWGDAPCEHPQLAKLYDLGVHTGTFACVQCGRIFSFREKAELAASRRLVFLIAALASLAFTPLTLSAQKGWTAIGATSAGNAVYVESRSVKRTGDLVAANVRVVFTEPVKGAKGTFASYRTSATFNCAKKSLAAKENVYFADKQGTKVIDRSVNRIPGFGPALGGSLGDVALKHLCAR